MEGVTHEIACECIPSTTTQPLCIWRFQGNDLDNTFMCGKRLYTTLFLDNKNNKEQIETESAATEAEIGQVITDLGDHLATLITTHESSLVTLHTDTKAERDTRIAEDAAINDEINDKVLAVNALLTTESLLSNTTITAYINDKYLDLKQFVVTTLSAHNSALETFVDDQMAGVTQDNQIRLNNWKQDLIDYTNVEAAGKIRLKSIVGDSS